MTAIENISVSVIDLLLEKTELCVNLQGEAGTSALWYSVATKSCAIVTQLLKHPNVDIDLPNSEGQTALWLAVFQGSGDMVRLLLSKGANPDFTDQNGISPWVQSFTGHNSIRDVTVACKIALRFYFHTCYFNNQCQDTFNRI